MLPRAFWIGLMIALAVGCGSSGNSGDDAPDDDAGVADDGDVDADGDAAVKRAPGFGGLTFVHTQGAGEVVLRWDEAIDDTAHASLEYLVFTGATATEVADAIDNGGTPVATVTGVTTHTLTAQPADTDLAIVVIAQDPDDERSANRAASLVRPSGVPLVVKKTPKVLANLGLAITQLAKDRFSVSGAQVGTLAAGDIIVVDNTFGRTLREIVALTAGTGGAMIMTTQRASLGEVIESGSIRSTATLAAPGGVTSTLAAPAQAFADQDLKLSYEVAFEPKYQAEINYTPNTIAMPESVLFIAEAEFSVHGIASYTVTSAKEFKKQIELVKRSKDFAYSVGPVPVVQTVTMTLMAEIEAKADTAFNATLDVEAKKNFKFGFAWAPGSGFFPIRDDGFEEKTTFSLTGEASASVVVKIYPVLETTLYKVAAAKITVDPTLELKAHARFLPPPAELDKFDLDFHVGVTLAADLTVLGKQLASWTSDRYELYRVPLFSLPEVKIHPPRTASICHPAKFIGLISDGVNNAVPNGTTHLTWETSGGTITPDAGGRIATVESMTPGVHTITLTARGNGILGVLGRRIAETTVEFVDPGVPCNMEPPPPDHDDAPLSCYPAPGAVGLYAPPWWKKNRIALGELTQLVIPMIRQDEFSYMISPTYFGPELSRQGAYEHFVDGGGVRLDFVGEHQVNSPNTFGGFPRWLVGDWGPSSIAIGSAMNCFPGSDQTSGGMDGFFRFTDVSCDYWDKPCVLRQNFPGSAQWCTAQGGVDDCFTEDTGIQIPILTIVGPREDQNLNATPAGALPLVHGIRQQKKLRPADQDFFRFPADMGGGGIFDAEKPDPGCDVVVQLDYPGGVTPVPGPRLTIYRNETDAKADANRVIQGSSPLRFTADPTKIYFVRVQHTNQANAGDYVAEIDSECTASTVFPQMTGAPTLSAPTLTADTDIDITVPVNQLAASVEVTLLEPLGQGYASGTTSVPVPLGASSVVVTVHVDPNVVADQYYVQVNVLNTDATHIARYTVEPGFATNVYTEKLENLVATTESWSPTMIPISYATAQ